jgi:hypothetical protein
MLKNIQKWVRYAKEISKYISDAIEVISGAVSAWPTWPTLNEEQEIKITAQSDSEE